MSNFAQIDNQNIVVRVIVAEQDFIDLGLLGDPTKWIQTSYNTYAGQHKLGKTPLRKNYAGIGFTYDQERDAFIPPRPYPSWQLNEATCLWDPPMARPDDGQMYRWDETTTNWILITE